MVRLAVRLLRGVAAALVACAAACLALPALAQSNAGSIDPRRAAQVKGAYVLNFIRYTEWPAGANTGPIVVTVLGRSNLGRSFEQVISHAEPIGERPLEVRRLRYPQAAPDGSLAPAAFGRFYDALANTQVLYVGQSEARRLPQVLARVGPGVLTVSDVPGFAASGGMVELVIDENRIVFELNADAIDRGGLRMGAKAMKLARAVHGTRPP